MLWSNSWLVTDVKRTQIPYIFFFCWWPLQCCTVSQRTKITTVCFPESNRKLSLCSLQGYGWRGSDQEDRGLLDQHLNWRNPGKFCTLNQLNVQIGTKSGNCVVLSDKFSFFSQSQGPPSPPPKAAASQVRAAGRGKPVSMLRPTGSRAAVRSRGQGAGRQVVSNV